MRTSRNRRVACGPVAVATVVVVGMAAFLPASTARGDWNDDNWCDRDQLDVDWTDTFAGRGVPTDAALRDMSIAGSWWWDVQANLGLGGFSPTTLGCSPLWWCYDQSEDPGLFSMQCKSEWSGFVENPSWNAGTAVDFWWHPTCDFWGSNADEWYMIVRSDIPNNGVQPACTGSGSPAPGSGWAVTHGQVQNGAELGTVCGEAGQPPCKTPLFQTLAHELGHVWGRWSHSNNPNDLMYGPWWMGKRIRVPDADWLIVSQGEGKRLRPVRTAAATKGFFPQLTFGALNTVSSSNSLWMPAVAGNRTANGLSTWGEWGAVWVDSNYKIVFGKGTESASIDSAVTVTQILTTEMTRNNPGIAVAYPGDRIGIGWTGLDQTVNFMVSADGGSTWNKTTFWGQTAIGGVSVAFSENMQEWIVMWVADRSDGDAMQIAHRVSDDATGIGWAAPTWVMDGSIFTMPIRQPAVNCQRGDTAECVAGFTSFNFAHKPLMSAGFQVAGNGLEIWDDPVNLLQADRAITNLAMTHHEASFGGFGYLMTYIPVKADLGPTPGRMKYAWLADSAAPTGQFRDTQEWTNGPLARSGFAVAWNYKRFRFRFLWRED